MKVLKRVPWSYKFTCNGCKSELEAEREDVCVGEFGCYDEFATEYYVKCVVCGTTHKIKAGIIPQDIKNEAKKS